VTADADATWVARTQPCPSKLSFPGYVDLSATQGVNPSLWVVCGGQPGGANEAKAVYVSADDGISWSLRSSAPFGGGAGSKGTLPAYGYVGPIDAVSPSRAYMALGRLGIVVSTDGGGTWKQTSTTSVAGAAEDGTVDFVDSAVGWALYAPLGLWRTTEGSAWTPLDGTEG
jgi:hypothetical protein